ncbi:hypothetical protein ACPV50_06140 [Vibrio astriarenae]
MACAFYIVIIIFIGSFVLYGDFVSYLLRVLCLVYFLVQGYKALKIASASRSTICEVMDCDRGVSFKTFSGKRIRLSKDVVFVEDRDFFSKQYFMIIFGGHDWSRKVVVDGECYYLSGKRDEMVDAIKMISGTHFDDVLPEIERSINH